MAQNGFFVSDDIVQQPTIDSNTENASIPDAVPVPLPPPSLTTTTTTTTTICLLKIYT